MPVMHLMWDKRGGSWKLGNFRTRNHIWWNTSSKSIIKNHRSQLSHDFDWNNIQILDEEPIYNKCLVSEILNIKKQSNSFNLQTDTDNLHKSYISIINNVWLYIAKIYRNESIENVRRFSLLFILLNVTHL